eukprot:TRINITY_DN2095_c0_g2_i1.p1 TRINITY_DN2095_c0_g2~~TRINITY_DN2095_c0_g2_i1.p1  ORF type:complete len:147 (+),score=38.96 TRINITY_DN2095_c0_g2_i1:86-526(+)
MAPAHSRRSALFAPAAVLVACMWLCAPSSFVNRGIYATPAPSRTAMHGFMEGLKQLKSTLAPGQSRTSMGGFTDEFTTLTADEQLLVLKQTASDYEERYKSEEFQKMLNKMPQDKRDYFNNVLQKFFDVRKDLEELLEDQEGAESF